MTAPFTAPTGPAGRIFDRCRGLLERAGLVACVALALVSTGIWWAVVAAPWAAPAPLEFAAPLYYPVMWATGAAYSALVLFRYVSGAARACVLAGAGVFTYWLGFHIAFTPLPWTVVNAALAGAITAMFLGYLTARLGRLRLAWRMFGMLAAAGALGGAVIGGSINVDYFGDAAAEGAPHPAWFTVGHGLWQVLTCVALYFSPQDEGAADPRPA